MKKLSVGVEVLLNCFNTSDCSFKGKNTLKIKTGLTSYVTSSHGVTAKEVDFSY